jgi:ABC-type multidrug transport system ATPase subunit
MMRIREQTRSGQTQHNVPYAELRGVSVKARGNTLLDNASFQVHPGEMVYLKGPNGAGKSTILRTLGLIEPVGTPDVTGDVMLFGHNMSAASSKVRKAIIGGRVGIGFQSPEPPRSLRVYQHLTVLSDILGIHVDDRRIEEVVKLLDLGNKLESDVATLSGGQLQRLSLARTALKDPDLWLLDEPTAAVDTSGKEGVFGAIRGWCDEGAAAVIVSHDEQIADYATREVTLLDGRIIS